MSKKTVVIVLGNRLNDDGSITKIQEERLKMALELEEMFHPDYFILSGGLANPIPQLTEAEAVEDDEIAWEVTYEISMTEDLDIPETKQPDNVEIIHAPDVETAIKYAEQSARIKAKEDSKWLDAEIIGIKKKYRQNQYFYFLIH